MKPLEEMTREEFLRARLEEILGDMDAARETGRAWTALGHMHRQVIEVHSELTQLRAQREAQDAAAEDAALSDADVVALLVQSIGELPDHLLGEVEAALTARRAS